METEQQLRQRIARTPILSEEEVRTLGMSSFTAARLKAVKRLSKEVDDSIKRDLKKGKIMINKEGRIVPVKSHNRSGRRVKAHKRRKPGR